MREKLSLPLLGALAWCICRQAKVIFPIYPIDSHQFPFIPCPRLLIDIQRKTFDTWASISPIGRPGTHLHHSPTNSTLLEDHPGLGKDPLSHNHRPRFNLTKIINQRRIILILWAPPVQREKQFMHLRSLDDKASFHSSQVERKVICVDHALYNL